jgi:hypothetical protein
MNDVIWYLLVAAIVAAAAVAGVYASWHVRSRYRRYVAPDRPPRAHRDVLWRDPGEVERLDLSGGPGGRDGAPKPSFRFVTEHGGGTNPCVEVEDANGRRWRVKWGDEVQSETFATRFVWAAGYVAESNYLVPEGVVVGCEELGRASSCIDEEGRFANARFELDEPAVRKLFDEHGWSWDENPFVGTRELAGLKILVMLLSNWDNKDVRDVARGSNTAIFEHVAEDGAIEAHYLIIDWGATMGKWGIPGLRGKWDPAAFAGQSSQLVTGVTNGTVSWGYVGQRTDDAIQGITVDDVRWLLGTVGRITDAQIGDALDAAGATPDERETFTRALGERISLLRTITDHRGNGPGRTPRRTTS